MHKEFASPEALRDTIKRFGYERHDSGDQESEFDVLPNCKNAISIYKYL